MNIVALLSAFTGAMFLLLVILTGNKIQNRWKRYSFALLGVVTAMFFIGYIPVFIGDKSMETSGKSGEYLVYIVIAFSIMKSIFFKKRDDSNLKASTSFPKRNGVTLLVSAVLIVLASVIISMRVSVQTHQKYSREAINEIANFIENDKKNPSKQKLLKHDNNNPLNKIVKLSKKFISKRQQLDLAYEQDLDQIGLDGILEIINLENDKNLVKSKEKVSKALGVINHYEQLTISLIYEMRKDYTSLNLAPSIRKEITGGFNRGIQTSKKESKQYWEYERGIIKELEQIINLLASEKVWKLEDNQIAFYTNDNLEKFNQHQAKISKLSEQQEQLEAKALARIKQNLSKS